MDRREFLRSAAKIAGVGFAEIALMSLGVGPKESKAFTFDSPGNGTGTAGGGGSSTAVARWEFESGALTTDSKGSNTLTNNNSVTADTTYYQQGSASALFDGSTNYFSITDANLDSGFPLKSTESNKVITICCWFRLNATTSSYTLFDKGVPAYNTRSIFFFVGYQGSGDTVKFGIGYNSGASAEPWTISVTQNAGTWYWIGASFDDSTKQGVIRYWDGSSATTYTHTFTNNINLSAADVEIGFNGSTSYMDGEIDDLAVFSSALSDTDMDAVRNGTYGY